jgi:nucleotide-binding universal stress UspA family protein
MYRRIVVPLDGSELAETALPCVRLLAQHSGAEIVLLRVAEYPSELYSTCHEYPPLDPLRAAQLDERKKAIRREAQRYLQRIAAGLEKAGIKVVVRALDGPVVEAILDCTEHLGADVIVMSTHAQSGFSHWIIGAVADRVLHEAKVPVLLMRPPAQAAGLRVHDLDAIHDTPDLVTPSLVQRRASGVGGPCLDSITHGEGKHS